MKFLLFVAAACITLLHTATKVQGKGHGSNPSSGKDCCPADKFECDNGDCIRPCQVCNGFNNCKDGSDECNCDKSNCVSPHRFLCDNKRCLRSALVRNGRDDCGDNSDERDSSQELKDAGVDAFSVAGSGDSMLHLATSNNLSSHHNLNASGDATQVVRLLLRAYEQEGRLKEMLEKPDGYKNTALCLAAQLGDASAVNLLLEFGANLEGPCQHDASPLLFAAGYNDLDVVKVLLNAGANTAHVDSLTFDLKKWAIFNSNHAPVRTDVLAYLTAQGHVV